MGRFRQLLKEKDLLHQISDALTRYKPEGGFSPFGAGGVGYLFGGPQIGVPLAIAEATAAIPGVVG